MSISGFPDTIYVVFGPQWKKLFAEDEQMTLYKVGGATSTTITYSENGDSGPSINNRLSLYINYPGTGNGNQWTLYVRDATTSLIPFYKMARFQVGGVGTAVVGPVYSLGEFYTQNVLINVGGDTFTDYGYLSKTVGNSVGVQGIFKYLSSTPPGGPDVAGGEINVKTWGDYTVVLDGSTTPVYLGESKRLQTGKIKKMVIENLHHTQPLYVSDITVSGNFRIMESLSDIVGYDATSEDVIIPALGYTTFRIQQLTQDFGHHQGTVTITSGDVDEGEYTFLVSGDVTTGIWPKIILGSRI